MANLEKALTLILKAITSGNEFLVVAVAVTFFVVGAILIYKKGPWFGFPFALAGILLVIMAIIAEILSL